MQDRYAGDIGDFGKHGLLRALACPETNDGPRLGVVWYLTPDEAGNRDDRHTGYLRLEGRGRDRFTACDEYLYRTLGDLVNAGNRSVNAVRESGILPGETVYHDAPLDLRNAERKPGETLRQARERERSRWNSAALEKTGDCGVVFLDPDNGLETGSVKPHAARGPKYAYYAELEPYLGRGQSLVVYHHLNRSSRAIRQIYQRQREIYERFRLRSLAMRYHRGSPRVFLIIPQREHREHVMDRTRGMMTGPWAQHFTMIG